MIHELSAKIHVLAARKKGHEARVRKKEREKAAEEEGDSTRLPEDESEGSEEQPSRPKQTKRKRRPTLASEPKKRYFCVCLLVH